MIVPISTWGRNASCWPRLKRWISSTKRIVRAPRRARAASASARTARISLTPERTAVAGELPLVGRVGDEGEPGRARGQTVDPGVANDDRLREARQPLADDAEAVGVGLEPLEVVACDDEVEVGRERELLEHEDRADS